MQIVNMETGTKLKGGQLCLSIFLNELWEGVVAKTSVYCVTPLDMKYKDRQ